MKTLAQLAPGYEIRKFRPFEGMEGPGFSLDLHRDGKRVATVLEEGNGGMIRLHWTGRDEEAAFAKVVEARREEASDKKGEGGMISEKEMLTGPEAAGYLVTLMVGAFEAEKRFRRLVKTKTIFTLDDQYETQGAYQEIARPFTPELKAHILKKYAGRRVTILNEVLP